MLNLREKLLNAGLVTDKQVKKVEENKKKQHQKRKEKFQKAKKLILNLQKELEARLK